MALQIQPSRIYLFKANNRITRKLCEICSKLDNTVENVTNVNSVNIVTQLTLTCTKSPIETLQKDVKYVQS